jgi:hypothetical protein
LAAKIRKHFDAQAPEEKMFGEFFRDQQFEKAEIL